MNLYFTQTQGNMKIEQRTSADIASGVSMDQISKKSKNVFSLKKTRMSWAQTAKQGKPIMQQILVNNTIK